MNFNHIYWILTFFVNFNFEQYQMLQVGSTVENESCRSGFNTQVS